MNRQQPTQANGVTAVGRAALTRSAGTLLGAGFWVVCWVGLGVGLWGGFGAGPAQAQPEVYGRLFMSQLMSSEQRLADRGSDSTPQFVAFDSKERWELTTNASRLGVKGEYALSDALGAIYQLEYEVQGDGSGDPFKQRNTYVGLKGDWGRFLVGRHDTPAKMLGRPADMFNDLPYGDVKNVMLGEHRLNNTLMYRSPDWSGFSFDLAVLPRERGERTTSTESFEDNGLTDQTSLALHYAHEFFTLGVALNGEVFEDDLPGIIEQAAGISQGNVKNDMTRIVATVKPFEGFKLIFMSQSAENADGRQPDVSYAEQDGSVFGIEYKHGDWKFKLMLADSETILPPGPSGSGVGSVDVSMQAFGVDYKLDKKFKAIGYFSIIEGDASNRPSIEYSTLGLGMELRF